MASSSNKKQQKKQVVNPLELLRDAGAGAAHTLQDELIAPMGKDFVNQLFGHPQKKYSGELKPGESMQMRDVMSGKQEKDAAANRQMMLERQIRDEERSFIEKKSHDLKMQIDAIQEEVEKIAAATPKLAKELEIAAAQAPLKPSVYDLFFLTHILNVLRSFRIKIENASVWLSTTNKRSAKKGGNTWGKNYKQHGGKYLLSGEHYLTRSAG